MNTTRQNLKAISIIVGTVHFLLSANAAGAHTFPSPKADVHLTAAPELVTNEKGSAEKTQIRPGETKQWKIRILESIAPETKNLRVHIWNGEFGNKAPFNIAVYLVPLPSQ